MDKRTIVCKVRLTPEEHDLFKQKASGYGNLSAMIRDAVRQFNDIGTVRRMEALNEMTELYRKYQQDLSWLGGNFKAMNYARTTMIKSSFPKSGRYLHFLKKSSLSSTKLPRNWSSLIHKYDICILL